MRLSILFTIKTRHKRKDSCVIIMKKRMSIDNLTVMKSAVSRAKTVLELYSRMDDLIERRAVGRMAIQKDQKPRKRTQSNYPAWSSYFEGKIQLSIESNPSSLWYCFTSLCDWSRRLTPPSQPIRYNTKTNAALDTCVFQHFMHFACILFNFTFSNYDANHHSDLVLSLLWI